MYRVYGASGSICCGGECHCGVVCTTRWWLWAWLMAGLYKCTHEYAVVTIEEI